MIMGAGVANAMAAALAAHQAACRAESLQDLRHYLNLPCGYCGRKEQKATHKSCDGCGAPRP